MNPSTEGDNAVKSIKTLVAAAAALLLRRIVQQVIAIVLHARRIGQFGPEEDPGAFGLQQCVPAGVRGLVAAGVAVGSTSMGVPSSLVSSPFAVPSGAGGVSPGFDSAAAGGTSTFFGGTGRRITGPQLTFKNWFFDSKSVIVNTAS